MKIKIVTWNVNSIRIRLPLLEQLVKMEDPEVVCLQEVKAKEEDFPFDEVKALGFKHIALYGMPGYNGVAILSKLPLSNIKKIDWVSKTDARHIQATILNDIEINNIYIPAGGDIPDPTVNLSFAHKLAFIDDMSEFFEKNKAKFENKKMIICGDFNVAPLEHDVWGHKQLLKTISHTPIEVERITRLQNSLDFTNTIRHFHPEPKKMYSWWSYRNPKWQTNDKGRLLDHIWSTPALENHLKDVRIIKIMRELERPSDHVPVILEIEIKE